MIFYPALLAIAFCYIAGFNLEYSLLHFSNSQFDLALIIIYLKSLLMSMKIHVLA